MHHFLGGGRKRQTADLGKMATTKNQPLPEITEMNYGMTVVELKIKPGSTAKGYTLFNS